jgi:hypothetical protein
MMGKLSKTSPLAQSARFGLLIASVMPTGYSIENTEPGNR